MKLQTRLLLSDMEPTEKVWIQPLASSTSSTKSPEDPLTSHFSDMTQEQKNDRGHLHTPVSVKGHEQEGRWVNLASFTAETCLYLAKLPIQKYLKSCDGESL